MAAISALIKRFSELEQQMAAVEATKRYENSPYSSGEYVDGQAFLNWVVKARNLIDMACTKESAHYDHFVNAERPRAYTTNYELFKMLKSIFLAAKEDYEGGHLNSVRSLVQAEVFENELDQARELLRAGYRSAAAVVAGVVLETTLRQLCTDRDIPIGKLDRMNSDLTKAGAYNVLVQKRVTALADIRNNAAHGHPEHFKDDDVSDMITYIEKFISEQI